MRIIRTNLPEMAMKAFHEDNRYAYLGFREYTNLDPVNILTMDMLRDLKNENRQLTEIEKIYLASFENGIVKNEKRYRNY